MVGIQQAIPAIGDHAVIEAKSAVVKVIAQLIRSLVQGIADLRPEDRGGGGGASGFFHL
jgi:hypothetical protein